MKKKDNPYESGSKDGYANKVSANPYPEFSEKWALYNKGYNSHHPVLKHYYRQQNKST